MQDFLNICMTVGMIINAGLLVTLNVIETKNGSHLLTKPFNLNKFQEECKKAESEALEAKKKAEEEKKTAAEKLAKEKNCTVSQIALAWLLAQDVKAFPIVSASTSVRIKENIKALDIFLSEEEAQWLNLEI